MDFVSFVRARGLVASWELSENVGRALALFPCGSLAFASPLTKVEIFKNRFRERYFWTDEKIGYYFSKVY